MRTLFYCCISLLLLSCTKKEVVEVEADSFRVSILPVAVIGFDQYKITGTVDVRKTSNDIEYGLVVGRDINPVLERDKVFKIGTSNSTADFAQTISGLDTGAVQYVRGYGKSSTGVQYSANQRIGKLSPKLSSNAIALQYGQSFQLFITADITGVTPVVKLNGNSITLSSDTFPGPELSVISFIPPTMLSPGDYTLTVDLGHISLAYPGKLKLLEGTWSILPLTLPRNFTFTTAPDRFVSGDKIYTFEVVYPFNASLSSYNYKTGETQTLKPVPRELLTRGASILQVGNKVHFFGGQLLLNVDPYPPATNAHRIYDISSDSWTDGVESPGSPRQNAAVMIVGDRIFYGLGRQPLTTGPLEEYKDLWMFDPNATSWRRMADFPGTATLLQSYFDVDGKLYVIAGTNSQNAVINETWCYDAALNQWSRKADYPGEGNIGLLTFNINGKGYAGMGQTISYGSYYGRNIFQKMYRYTPMTDKWEEVSNFGVPKAEFFVGKIGETILVGGGYDSVTQPSPSIFTFKP